MKKYIVLFTSIALSAVILVVGLLSNHSNNDVKQSHQPTATTTPEPQPTPMPTVEPEPPATPNPVPELIAIDNTPAEEHVDIAAGAGNPANALPWAAEGEPTRVDGRVIAIGFDEIDLENDGIVDFAWEEILQKELDTLEIWDPPPELLDLPQRQIQNRDAARVVANEMLGALGTEQVLGWVLQDEDMNVWIFVYGLESTDPHWSVLYAVSGYNGQVIRGWIS